MSARPARVRFIAMQLALAAAVGTALWLSFPGWRLGHHSEKVRRQFPDVRWISPGDLVIWRAAEKRVKPLVLDVRTPEEFAFSHLPEAHLVDPLADLRTEDLPSDNGQPIVLYCSTGERSAAFAQRLQRAGYGNVFTLEGAIVRWANEWRPLTNEHALVTRVHSADEHTAGLLNKVHRSTP